MKTTVFLAIAAMAAVGPMQAMTNWSAQYSGVTYVAVTEGMHGINSPNIGAVCTDSSGNRLTLDQVSWTVDANTYEVDLTFTNSFTGTVHLSGPWPASDTSNPTDFLVTISQTNSSKLNVCAQCGTYTARRTYNGGAYVSAGGVSLTWVYFSAPTVFVYLRENMVTYGLAQAGCAVGSYQTSGVVNVECGVMSMPTGVVPLGSATISGGVFTGVTDLRPW